MEKFQHQFQYKQSEIEYEKLRSVEDKTLHRSCVLKIMYTKTEQMMKFLDGLPSDAVIVIESANTLFKFSQLCTVEHKSLSREFYRNSLNSAWYVIIFISL